jgi:hypothetical protein
VTGISTNSEAREETEHVGSKATTTTTIATTNNNTTNTNTNTPASSP